MHQNLAGSARGGVHQTLHAGAAIEKPSALHQCSKAETPSAVPSASLTVADRGWPRRRLEPFPLCVFELNKWAKLHLRWCGYAGISCHFTLEPAIVAAF
jgi:hypothetical protein